jgi:predicted nucleic acid-binding protein
LTPDQVPAGPVLLDTNVVSYIARDTARAAAFKALIYGHLQVISFVTVGEVLKGAIKAKMLQSNVAKLEGHLALYEVVTGTARVARTYARVRVALELVGVGCEDNDVWIAACALAQPVPLPVVTGDSDFDRIAAVLPELVVVRP